MGTRSGPNSVADLQLSQLRAFVTVWRLGSYGLAAEALSYTETAVYVQVKKLEATLGLPLLRRQRKRIVLTSQGERLIGPAASLVEQSAAFMHLAVGLQGKIVVAAGEQTAPARIIPIVAAYREVHPEHTVEVHSAEIPAILKGVIDGKYDVGVVSYIREREAALPQQRREDIINVPWLKDRWCLVAPRCDPRDRDVVPVYAYDGLGFVDEPALSIIAEAVGKPVEVFELNTMDLLTAAVENGLGLGILPSRRVDRGVAAGTMTSLGPIGYRSVIRLDVIHRRSRYLERPVRDFICFLLRARAKCPAST